LTDKTITDLEMLRGELEHIRRQGYAVAEQELEVGFIAIGAPVRDHNARVVAAISVNGPTARLTRDRILQVAELVKSGADRISEQLGFRSSAAQVT
jgi:IclR family acetate operon transcriptional repressor